MSDLCFVEWFKAQAKSDPDDEQAFAGLYPYGPYFVTAFGKDAPDPRAFKVRMDLEGPFEDDAQEDLLRQLVIADATWRTDMMVDEPEPTELIAGVEITPRTVKPFICGFRDLDGTQCRASAVPGAARCNDHGGAITDPGVRGSLLLLAYAQMVHGAKKAVDTLIDVMEGSHELAKVQAAKELLDRAGLGVDQGHVTVTQASDNASDTRAEALDRMRQHLDSIKGRMLPAPPPDDDEIVDAELVEDEDPIARSA